MRRSRAERGFSIALATFAVVLAVHIFLQSPFFRLQKVVITGSEALSRDEILEIADLQFETNLFDLDLIEASRRLTTDPRVADVEFRRQFPSALVVSLVERRPVAFLSTAERLWQVDAEGRILGEYTGDTSLVMLTGSTAPSTVQLGEVLSDPGLKLAATLAGKLPEDLALVLSEVHVVSRDALELVARSGTRIRFGAWRDVEQKTQVLLSLLSQVKTFPKSIDVSNPQSPVVR